MDECRWRNEETSTCNGLYGTEDNKLGRNPCVGFNVVSIDETSLKSFLVAVEVLAKQTNFHHLASQATLVLAEIDRQLKEASMTNGEVFYNNFYDGGEIASWACDFNPETGETESNGGIERLIHSERDGKYYIIITDWLPEPEVIYKENEQAKPINVDELDPEDFIRKLIKAAEVKNER